MSLSFSGDAAVVAFEFKKSNSRQLFVLIEFSGVERDRYLKTVQKNVSTSSDGKVTVKDIEGMQAGLLVLTAREVTAIDHFPEVPDASKLQEMLDSGELSIEHLQLRPLSMEEIQNWPSKSQTVLFTKAQELNGLTPNARDKEKND